ncbi:MaoC/PaaZ C-terminal domain-containing protein [Actinomadura citrea]|uniref:MaoC/PaaZ C-terminal domain-containing protein n=1 Tax=Actinomadura TaxID=1988 RepID=UPI002E27E41D|nr:MaoC/PaaZ C-terminal domain-containing protein [Actinomadura citrea]
MTAVAVGDAVPELVRRIELADMVAYAGATWDWQRMHYDPAYLEPRGLPAPVVDGQVFGALLAEQAQDWLGPSARLATLRFRFKNLVFANETVRCTGTVTAVRGDLVTIEQKIEVVEDGRVAVAPAGCEVRVPGGAR